MTEMNVYRKLAKARAELQKKSLKKSGVNPFAKFKYFELSDFLPAVNEIFDQVGLCSYFRIEDPYQEVNENTGTVFNIPARAELQIINADAPQEVIRFSSGIADAAMKGASPIQQLGSVHTYMRRYLWLEAMEITECDGVDALDQKTQLEEVKKDPNSTQPLKKIPQKKEVKKSKGTVTEEQMQKILALFSGKDDRLISMMDVYRIKDLSDLTREQADAVIRRMEGENV